jgi:hypothetical protein
MRVARASVVGAILLLLVAGSTVGGAAGASAGAPGGAATSPTAESVTDGSVTPPRTAPSATQSVASPSAERPTIRANLTVGRHPDPGAVTVRATFDLPSNVASFSARPESDVAERARITDATGFSEDEDGYLTWEDEESETDTPSFTMRYAVNRSAPVFDGLDYVGTGTWALFERPGIDVYWSYRGTRPKYERAVSTESAGYTTPTMVYLGEHETVETTRNDQRFTLVVPESAEPTSSSAVFATLETASSWLDVGETDDHVVVFRAPDPLRDGGLAAPADPSSNASVADSV